MTPKGKNPQSSQLPPISESLIPGSDKLFLFFGGVVGSIGMPPFEFYRSAGVLDYSRIFLRDASQAWYQRGLPGIGASAHAVGDYLRVRIEESGASEIRFVGNSMGGYAALMFCAMLRRGRAIAFAPQTFLSTEKRTQHGDHRWSRQIASLHDTGVASDICDLRSWIRDRCPEMTADVYVSSADALDMAHVDELAGFPNIRLHCFPDAGHEIVRKLRDDGMLARILDG